MAGAATAASKSVGPTWVGDRGDGRDGVPHNHLLYGHLKTKADTAVTESEIQENHLVLIGTAAENALVKKIQAKLPVSMDAGQITCSDGLKLLAEQALMGLFHYNPLAPKRLIYWIAADQPALYRPNNFLFQIQQQGSGGLDFVVVQDNPLKLLKVRHFDARWNWVGEPEGSDVLRSPETGKTGEIVRNIAESIRLVSGSDYALFGLGALPELEIVETTIATWADVAASQQNTPIAVMKLSGARILSYQKGFDGGRSGLKFYPQPQEGSIESDKIYHVAFAWGFFPLQPMYNVEKFNPDYMVITDKTVGEAIRRILY